MKFIDNHQLSSPYPVKAIHPPQRKGDPDWRYYFAFGDLNREYEYHNGGAWPMIGGFYLRALFKVGNIDKAHSMIDKLIEANQDEQKNRWLFPEHRHGKLGHSLGMQDQAWSAGAFLYALGEVSQDIK